MIVNKLMVNDKGEWYYLYQQGDKYTLFTSNNNLLQAFTKILTGYEN